ncbi:MAG: hypothetical protein HY791_10200 [Deltaproteobacteria bacterium]|nr:hypothetical protein [Deltaproteobacteria bacterium]
MATRPRFASRSETRRVERRWLVAATASLSLAASAVDEDARTAAKEAYDRGARAYALGDFAGAALDLGRADELLANDVALAAALRAVVAADNPELGMVLVKRALSRSSRTNELTAASHSAESKFRSRTTELLVSCGACTATLDGVPIAVDRPVFVRSGVRDLVVERAGARRRERLELPAGGQARFEDLPRLTEPPTGSAEISADLGTYSVFIAGGLTTLLGAATAISGVDTQRKHTAFIAGGCPGIATASCLYAAETGQAAETRTNTLLVTTVVSAAATILLYLIVGSDR